MKCKSKEETKEFGLRAVVFELQPAGFEVAGET